MEPGFCTIDRARNGDGYFWGRAMSGARLLLSEAIRTITRSEGLDEWLREAGPWARGGPGGAWASVAEAEIPTRREHGSKTRSAPRFSTWSRMN